MKTFKNFNLTKPMIALLKQYQAHPDKLILADKTHLIDFEEQMDGTFLFRGISAKPKSGSVLYAPGEIVGLFSIQLLSIDNVVPPCEVEIRYPSNLFEAMTGDDPDDPWWEGTWDEHLSRAAYKDFPCGPWLKTGMDQLNGGFYAEVGSIVEGSDAEVGPYRLQMPFLMSDLHRLLEQVNTEACALWKEANEDEV